MQVQKYDGIEIEIGANTINPYYIYFRKIGISLLLLFLILSFFGLFGSGYFHQPSKTNKFLTIHYQKFIRLQATSAYEIVVHDSNMCAKGKLELWVNANFLKGMSFKEMNPKPRSQIIMNGKTLFVFDCEKGTKSASINIIVEPEKFGFHDSQVGLGNEVINLSQLIYP